MSDDNVIGETEKSVLFLPDRVTPTGLEAGDLLVWEKDKGSLYMQRPGIGRLHSPVLDASSLQPGDVASAGELEGELATGIGWSGMMIGLKLIDESEGRAIYEFTGPEAS